MENIYLLLFVVLVVFLVSLKRLIYGVYILLILLPFERLWVTRQWGLHIKLAEWMGLVCIIIFIWNFLAKPQRRMFSYSPLKPLFLFGLVNILLFLPHFSQVINFGDIENWNSPGFRSVKVVIWCMYSILLALAVAYSIKDKDDLRGVITVLLGNTILWSAISLFSLLLEYSGIHFWTWALIERKGFIGIKATYSEPSYYAHYMSMIVPIGLMVFIFRIYRLGLFFTVSACFVLLLANYLSFSTTGLAGLTLTLAVVPLVIRHYRLVTTSKGMRYVIAILICIYIIFMVGVFFNIDFIKATSLNYFKKVSTPEGRWAGREMGVKMFKDRPIFGRGPGNWSWHAEKDYADKVKRQTRIRPSYNNLYLEILVDLGLLGFIPFAWFFISFFRQLSRSVWKARDIFLKAVLVGLIIGIIALLGEYHVCFNFYRIHVWPIFGIAFAAIRLAGEESTEE